jgi:transcriptional regulator EpsA
MPIELTSHRYMKPGMQTQAMANIARLDSFQRPPSMRQGLVDPSSAEAGLGENVSRVVESSREISRPSHLLVWLQGELQKLLPHQVLIVAWGQFATGDIRYNVVSLPGAEIDQLPHREISPLLRKLYSRWVAHGRQAFGVATAASEPGAPALALPEAFSSMRSILVHGLNDEHTGRDRLYVTMNSDSSVPAGLNKTFQLLMPCIDRVLRRISTLRTHQKETAARAPRTALSEREREILEWVRKGKTNHEIGTILGISQFTVKNHLQRIFRKMDVLNRAQAIGKLSGDGEAAHSFFP